MSFTVNQLIEQSVNIVPESTQDRPLIGYTVSANMDTSIEIKHTALKQVMTSAGFGAEEYEPPMVRPRTYIDRAIRVWLKEMSGDTGPESQMFENKSDEETKQKSLVREIKNKQDKDTIVLALVKENIDLAQLGLSYLTNLRVFYTRPEKAAPGDPQLPGRLALTLSASGVTDPATYIPTQTEQSLIQRLQRHVDYYSSIYTSAELSRMSTRVIASLDARSLRNGGSVYFVPITQRDRLIAVKDLLEQQLPQAAEKRDDSKRSRLLHIPIADEPYSKAQVAEATHENFQQTITAYKKDMQQFAAENKKRGIKENTMAERMQRYKELRDKVYIYKNLLELETESIERELGELEQQAQTLIGLRQRDIQIEMNPNADPDAEAPESNAFAELTLE